MEYPEVKCLRCQTVNEFHVVESGPHLKAICDNCGRYIKFIPRNGLTPSDNSKTPPEGSNRAQYKMANIISVRIDVLKIDKAKLFKGEKGTYLDVVLLMKDAPDAYGNHGMAVQQVTKEERAAGIKGNILGNAKILGGTAESIPAATAQKTAAVAAPDDLPF